MESATSTQPRQHSLTAAAALRTVLLPGPIETRARAAATLPAWLPPLLVACLLPLILEVGAYAAKMVDKCAGLSQGYRYDFDPASNGWHQVTTGQPTFAKFMALAWDQLRPMIPQMLRHRELIILPIIYVSCLLLLEIVNLVFLVPFAASLGERFFHVEPRTRNIIFSLAPLWVLQGVFIWALIVIFAGPLTYCGFLHKLDPGLTQSFLIVFTAIIPSLLLPSICILRLIRAASRLRSQTPCHVPQARCGFCGYFLEGLADAAPCPECGAPDPQLPDRQRQPSPWAHRVRLGRSRAFCLLILQVLFTPTRMFSRMEVLSHPRAARRFLVTALCVGTSLWPLVVLAMVFGYRAVRGLNSPNIWGPHCRIVAAFAAFGFIIGLAVFCLLICLIGVLISRSRQEPAWPIAATAGCYLAGLFPWTIMAQVVWQFGYACLDRHSGYMLRNTLMTYCQALHQTLAIPWPVFYSLILAFPSLLATCLAIRTAILCARSVRYACR